MPIRKAKVGADERRTILHPTRGRIKLQVSRRRRKHRDRAWKLRSLASFCSALDDEELFILLSAILDRRPEAPSAILYTFGEINFLD